MVGAKLVVLVLSFGAGLLTARENKGSCPPTPAKHKAPAVAPPQTAPEPGEQFAGAVALMLVISDKGYVCDARVLRGIDKEIDEQTLQTVRQWHLQPTRKDGHNVPVVADMNVNYWCKDGKLIPLPATLPASQPAK
ncbi:MAG TPA: energy transducer TonB [Terriglobia bacterium]|nr:energy transducer TonB [Terriglobia bacterium]